jgi:hypothetical protein
MIMQTILGGIARSFKFLELAPGPIPAVALDFFVSRVSGKSLL